MPFGIFVIVSQAVFRCIGVTDQQAGYLYSMQGLVIILGTIAVGWVGDKFSRSETLCYCLQ